MERKIKTKAPKKMVEKPAVVNDEPVTVISPPPPPAKRKATARRTVYMVANQHTGNIMLNRSGKHFGLQTAPLVLPAGQAVPVDAEEWTWHKQNNAGLRRYLDAKLIVEVDQEGEVPVRSATSSHAEIPEHLKRPDEEGGKTGVKGTLKRSNLITM